MSDALRISTLPPLGSLPLARGSLDRGCALRADPLLIDELWGQAGTLVMFIARGTSPVTRAALVFKESAAVIRPANPVYLGRTLDQDQEDDGVPAGTHIMLAILDEVDASIQDDEGDDDGGWLGLRDAAATLSGRDAGLFVQAAAIANWHARHTHCPRCGAQTEPVESGWVRRCPTDQSLHYPRTDPSIIVSVTDEDDRLLLGSAAAWPEGRFSTLAGFV